MRAIALVSVLALSAGCAGDRKQLRQTDRAERVLGESASAYWDAVRWNDFGTAAAFIEDQQERLVWMTTQGSGADYRYQSATVLRVEVGSRHDPDGDGVVREGTAAIQITGYRLPKQLLEQRVDLQRWYEVDSGAWFLSDEAPPPPPTTP